MTVYKIDGTTTHDTDVHIIQDAGYVGKKAVSSGNYSVSFESTTPSGVLAVAEKSDGEGLAYGGVIATTYTGIADISGGGGGFVKSINQINITMGGGSSSNTATISAVDMDNSYIVFTGSSAYETNTTDHYHGTLVLTNSTTVTAQRAGTSGDFRATGYVVELESGIINSIQRGTFVMAQDGGFPAQVVDETITSVDLSKTFVTSSYRSDGSNGVAHWKTNLYLQNATTLRAVRMSQYKSDACTVAYEVVEFA